MSHLNERLDALRALVQNEDFLEGRGLSNEVNIRIFCYDPAEEMAVRHFMAQMETDQTLSCRLIERDLYQIFLSICEDREIADEIADLEESDGSEYLLEQLEQTIGKKDFIEKMQYSPHEKGDVLVLTGVGDVFPFMRVHSLLEAMQKDFSDIPILVMYPGEFNGRSVKLFNLLEPNGFYRAFNVV